MYDLAGGFNYMHDLAGEDLIICMTWLGWI